MSWSFERSIWAVLIGGWLLIGALQGYKAWSFDPRPQAVELGTALVCDRTGCVER